MSRPDQGAVGSNYTILEQFQKGEQSLDISFQNRKGVVRSFTTGGFAVIDSTFNPSPDAAIWQHYNDRPLIELNFVLGGQLCQSQSGLFKRQLYTTGYHNCLFNPGSLEENELVAGKAAHAVSLQLDPDHMIRLILEYAPELEPFAKKITNRDPFLCQSPSLDLPVQIRSLLKSLWDGPAQSGLKRLHFESVVLQLLCYQFEQLMQARQQPSNITLKRSEIEKLHHARMLLLEQLDAPLPLSKLASACQLNEFNLKKGFKQLFGTTVFGYVLKQRMEAARSAVYNGDKTITEIAYELGYAHPQHFYRVFKKHYGLTPKEMKH